MALSAIDSANMWQQVIVGASQPTVAPAAIDQWR